jgi:hypothetical protein
VNHLRLAARLSLLVALAGTTSAGFASAPGATSRGTVSISITVPPHVLVSRLAGPDGGAVSEAGDSLCVAAVGYSNYHVALVPSREGATGLPDKGAARMSSEVAGESSCLAGLAGQASEPGLILYLRHPATQPLAGSADALTLLIVPD